MKSGKLRSIIRAVGQVCNVRECDEQPGFKVFNLHKFGGLVTTLVKTVYDGVREIEDKAEVISAENAIEFIAQDEANLIREGAKVIATCTDEEADAFCDGKGAVFVEVIIC